MSLIGRINRKFWTKLFSEEFYIDKRENFRIRERYGLISRPNYIYGMLRAADNAKYIGVKSITVVEMGVASGAGLINMIECADLITRETGITFRIVGFDTGSGLPSVEGYKDHPEIWNPGDFAMEDRSVLEKKIEGRATILWGDIDNTVDGFTASLSEGCPLGFLSVDVDIYSATKAGLRCLTDDARKYLPGVSMYFDDVSFFYANDWCGELLAINEFNAAHDMRKIGLDRSLDDRPRPQGWHSQMFVCHVLDHPVRQSTRARESLTIRDHHKFMQVANIQ